MDDIETPPEQAPDAERLPCEEWAKREGTEAWLLAGTRASQGWAIGREVTRDEFLSAVQSFANAPVGYGPKP